MRNYLLRRLSDPQALHSFPTRRSSDLEDYRHQPSSERPLRQLPLAFRYVPIRNLYFAFREVHEVLIRVRTVIMQLQSHTCAKRSEEHTSELQSQFHLVCRLLLEKKN